MKQVRRDPRITAYAIKNAKGGYVDITPRDTKQATRRIDTTPAHAKPTPALIGTNGVVLPIRNRDVYGNAEQRKAA